MKLKLLYIVNCKIETHYEYESMEHFLRIEKWVAWVVLGLDFQEQVSWGPPGESLRLHLTDIAELAVATEAILDSSWGIGIEGKQGLTRADVALGQNCFDGWLLIVCSAFSTCREGEQR